MKMTTARTIMQTINQVRFSSIQFFLPSSWTARHKNECFMSDSSSEMNLDEWITNQELNRETKYSAAKDIWDVVIPTLLDKSHSHFGILHNCENRYSPLCWNLCRECMDGSFLLDSDIDQGIENLLCTKKVQTQIHDFLKKIRLDWLIVFFTREVLI